MGRGFDEEHEFSADAVAGYETLTDIGDGAAEEFFVELGEFSSRDYAQCWAENGFEVGQGFGDAVRGFIEDDGLRGVAGLRG